MVVSLKYTDEPVSKTATPAGRSSREVISKVWQLERGGNHLIQCGNDYFLFKSVIIIFISPSATVCPSTLAVTFALIKPSFETLRF